MKRVDVDVVDPYASHLTSGLGGGQLVGVATPLRESRWWR